MANEKQGPYPNRMALNGSDEHKAYPKYLPLTRKVSKEEKYLVTGRLGPRIFYVGRVRFSVTASIMVKSERSARVMTEWNFTAFLVPNSWLWFTISEALALMGRPYNALVRARFKLIEKSASELRDRLILREIEVPLSVNQLNGPTE
jgi:hypothetical protein